MADFDPIFDYKSAIKAPHIRSLLDRSEEFRSRMIRVTAFLLGIWTLSFVFAKDILNVLKSPLLTTVEGKKVDLYFTGPLEVFLAYLHVSFLVAFFITAPLLLFNILSFISPAIGGETRISIRNYFIAALLLFLGGVAFCYFAMLPPALGFLIDGGRNVATPLITVGDYTSLVVLMMLGMGVVSELPVVLIVLVQLGLLSPSQLKRGRAIALVVILIVAAILTPTPDPLSQLLMAIPMYILYEAAILVIRLQGLGHAKK